MPWRGVGGSFGAGTDWEPVHGPLARRNARRYLWLHQAKDAVRTDTARTKLWQELRPLRQYLWESLEILQLAPKACQYYLPAFLYAMTDPEVVWCYLGPILDTLWYEDGYGDLLFNNTHARDRWEELTPLLTDPQKRCIAHWLVAVLRNIDDPPTDMYLEGPRIENMLEKYWNAWL